MSSADRYESWESSADRWIARGSSSDRWVADGSSADRWVADGSSSDRWIVPGAAAELKTFDLPLNASALANLDQSLTINGVTVAPTFRYEAKNATTSAWAATVGSNLTIAGAGADPTPSQGTPLLDSTDESVLFNAGKSYQAPAGSDGDIATEDFVFEAVLKHASGAVRYIADKRDSSGWSMWENAALVQLQLDYGAGDLVVGSVNLAAGTWNHILFFFDRSGSGISYVNGAAGTAVNISAGTASATSATKMVIGATDVLSNQLDGGSVALLQMWKRAAWLDSHLQPTLAAERFHKLIGIYPYSGKGTLAPTVATRASVAMLDKVEASGERKLYPVGAHVMRVCSRPDTGDVTRKGYLPEPAATNVSWNSWDLTNGSYWFPTRCSAAATSVVPPDQLASVTSVVHEDATAGSTHHIRTATLPITADNQYTYSIFSKEINRKYMLVWITGTGVSSVPVFDINAGTVTVADAAGTDLVGIEDWGDGWFRTYQTVTIPVGTTGVTVYHMIEAVSNATTGGAFNGLDQDSFALWGSQMELGVSRTSHIETTTAAVTRVADVLQHPGALNWPAALKIRAEVSCMLPNEDTVGTPYLLTVSDGGSATDNLRIYQSAADAATGQGGSTEGGNVVAGQATDLSDGDEHAVKLELKTGASATLTVDDVAGTPDTTAILLPDDIDEIDVGNSQYSNLQTGGLVSKVKIYKI